MIDDNVVVVDEKVSYESWHTLAFSHSTMLLKENLTPARFLSWCDTYDDNVVVLDRKLPYEN